MPKLIDSVVLNAVVATHGDATINYPAGTLAIAGLRTIIPLRKISKATENIAYAAGTPKAFTLTFTTNPVADSSYVLQLKKVNPRAKVLNPLLDELKENVETYGVVAATTLETNISLAQKFRTAILAAIANSSSSFASCLGGSNVLTLTLANAGSDVVASLKGSTTTMAQADTTPWVKENGTYAIVSKVAYGALTTGKYDTVNVYFSGATPGIGLDGGEDDQELYVQIFIESTDGDAGALEAYIVEVTTANIY